MNLIQVYEPLLQFAGMTADEKGYVSTFAKEPVIIGGNRLVLPTVFQLRECMERERIVFHPMAEDIVQSESPVVKKLRHNIAVRVNQAIGVLGQALLSLAASPALHKKLDPQQLKLLTSIREVDHKSAENFGMAAVANMKEAADRAFVHLYLCRGGTHEGKKYSRLGVVSFPCIAKIKEGDFYAKARVKDKDTFLELLNYMFPNCENDDAYNVGSDSLKAPFLHALMLTAGQLAARINELVELFEEYIPFSEDFTKEAVMFNMDWSPVIMNMEEHTQLINSVPPQSSAVVPPEPEAPVVTAAAPMVPVMHDRRAPAPVAAPAPVMAPEVVKTNGGLDFNSVLRKAQATAVASAYPGGVVVPQGMMMVPVGGLPPGLMPAGVPMGYPQQGMMPQGMMPQVRVPTWAQPSPDQVMVQTPQGPMTQAVAMQYGLQILGIIGPVNQGAPQMTPSGYGMHPVPGWAQGR